MTAKLDQHGSSGAAAQSIGDVFGAVVGSLGLQNPAADGVNANGIDNAAGGPSGENGDDADDADPILRGDPNMNESFQF